MQQEAQAVGQALPIVCFQHQGTTNFIKTAEEFDLYAKDGGCSLPCETRLLCGHVCPRYSQLKMTAWHVMAQHCIVALVLHGIYKAALPKARPGMCHPKAPLITTMQDNSY